MPERYPLEDLSFPCDSEVALLCAALPEIELLRFSDGERLVKADDTALDIFLLLRGAFVVEHGNPQGPPRMGQELAVLEATPEAPVFAGEMAYLGNGRRSASVRSVMSSWALRLTPRHIDGIIDGFPGLTRVLCRQFAIRLNEADQQLHHFQEQHGMNAKPCFLSPGETLFKSAEPADILYQLIEGVVRQITPAGEVLLNGEGRDPCFVEPGPYFRAGVRASTVIAESAATVLGIGSESRAAAVRNFPELVLSLL